jgi:hypothetical protein
MGPATCGAGVGGVVVCGLALPGGTAAGAARQSGAEAMSPSAARVRRLGLCLKNGGPHVCLEAIRTLPAAFGRDLTGRKGAAWRNWFADYIGLARLLARPCRVVPKVSVP